MSNEVALADWYKDDGDNTHLIDHPLTKNSLVLDVGGYLGDWSAKIAEKYDCFIQVFEPVTKAYNKARRRFQNNPKILVYNYGLSNEDKTVEISVNGDRSSCNQSLGTNIESAAMLSIKRLIPSVDLISINIEGDEYDLLPEMIQSGVIKRIRRLQVQFHDNYSNHERLRDGIREKLDKTHKEVYNYPFVWECWEIK